MYRSNDYSIICLFRNLRVLKSLSILLIVLIAVGTFLGYQLWFDFGPWVELPHNDVPENARQIDDQYAAAGRTAMDAVREHRDKHGFPAITAAVAVAQSVVWSGAVGWADVDGRIPATYDTLMRIGSTSKAVVVDHVSVDLVPAIAFRVLTGEDFESSHLVADECIVADDVLGADDAERGIGLVESERLHGLASHPGDEVALEYVAPRAVPEGKEAGTETHT